MNLNNIENKSMVEGAAAAALVAFTLIYVFSHC